MRIVIPQPAPGRFAPLFLLVPLAVPLLAAPSLWDFFQHTRTPEPVGVAFLAMLTLFFGVLPGITVVNGLMRAWHGYTEIRVTAAGVVIRERGAWRTRTVADVPAVEIIDVDYGTRETGAAAARQAAEQKLLEAGRDLQSMSPRMVRLLTAAARWTRGRGVVVKSRAMHTAFGQDLADDEIRYLHAVVRAALVA